METNTTDQRSRNGMSNLGYLRPKSTAPDHKNESLSKENTSGTIQVEYIGEMPHLQMWFPI